MEGKANRQWWFWFLVSGAIHATAVLSVGYGLGLLGRTRAPELAHASAELVIVMADRESESSRAEPQPTTTPVLPSVESTRTHKQPPEITPPAKPQVPSTIQEMRQTLETAPSVSPANDRETSPTTIQYASLKPSEGFPVQSANLNPTQARPSAGQSADVKIDYLHNPLPTYPERARKARQEGLVVLGVRVNRNGLVESVQVERGSGYALLDEAALRAVRMWSFRCTPNGELSPDSLLEVPVRFQLR